MVEPMRSENPGTQFSYADDIGILGIGRTIAESVTVIRRKIDNLMGGANNNAVSFDPMETEVIQFNGRRRKIQLMSK